MKTCVHLEALERELDAQGLRARLKIPQSVTFEEYGGRVAGSDATWYCQECKRAIMGLHPRYAPMGTPVMR